MNGDSSVMSDVVYWALWAVVWVAPGLVTALIARDRGRPVWRWLIVGVVFSWIALIAIVLLPDQSGQPHVSVQEWEEEKARSAAEREGAELDDGGQEYDEQGDEPDRSVTDDAGREDAV